MGVECNSATFTDLPLKRCRRFIEVLPDDILVQILSCLPCQSAVTCKLVCKRWLSLISAPSFISSFITHRRHAQQQHDDDDDDEKYRILKAEGYFFLTGSNSQLLNPDISFSFLPSCPLISSSTVFYDYEDYEIRILASSDDLFLCSRMPSIIIPYYICNPFTKEWLQLPQPPSSTSFITHRYVFGFTHNPYYHSTVEHGSEQQRVVQVNSSCRFCVVRLKFPRSTEVGASEFELDIFSSDTWQWTTSMMHHSSCPSIPSSCISRNGLLYWLCQYPGQVIIHDPYNNTVCYVVEFPPPATPCLLSFGVSQGSLLAFDKYSDVLRVWELEDDEVCNGGHQQQPKWRFVTRSLLLGFSTAIAVHPDDRNIIYLYSIRSGGIGTLSLRTGKLKHRFAQELVRTVNGRSYQVRSFKALNVEMIMFNAPCWPTPVSALLNSRRLASST